MRRTLNFSRVVMTVCLCIAGKLLSAGNLSDRNNKFTEKKLNLIQEWDKTFPENDKVRHSKVTFHNRYGITLAADLYIPKNAEGKLSAIAISGPFGAVKEQSSGLYAQTLAERGFLTIRLIQVRVVVSLVMWLHRILIRKISVQRWIILPTVTMWIRIVSVYSVFAVGVVWHSMRRLSILESKQQ